MYYTCGAGDCDAYIPLRGSGRHVSAGPYQRCIPGYYVMSHFFMGALLPPKGRYISKRMQIFLKILLALAVLGDERVSPAAYEAADGRIRLERFWEPAFPLTCLAIESIFLYFAPTEGVPYMVIILSKALFILLIVFTLIWRIAEQKENGTFKWLNAVRAKPCDRGHLWGNFSIYVYSGLETGSFSE